MKFNHSLATFALVFFCVGSSVVARAEAANLQPVDFVGIYELVALRQGSSEISPEQHPVRQIEIAADLSSNSLKSFVHESRIDNVGDYFLPPLTNVNLEARVSETRTPSGCEIRTQRSRSSETEILSTIEVRTKFACRITVKRRMTEYRVTQDPDSAEITFTVAKQYAPLETYIFKRLR